MNEVKDFKHIPVLLDEFLELIKPVYQNSSNSDAFVDATLGLGGHSSEVLKKFDHIQLIGIDRDIHALAEAKKRLGETSRVKYINSRFDELEELEEFQKNANVDIKAMLFDYGVSSMQLDNAERGFSYAVDSPLDMRMSDFGITAADVLNDFDEAEIRSILWKYGEEKFAPQIAKKIVKQRTVKPFSTTQELVDLIYNVIPERNRRTGGHPAKRTFQALRVFVNDELGSIETSLPKAFNLLSIGGILVCMSYQSLEDRIVKRYFQSLVSSTTPLGLPMELEDDLPKAKLLTKGAIKATELEIVNNPRAASVRMRALVKIREAN